MRAYLRQLTFVSMAVVESTKVNKMRILKDTEKELVDPVITQEPCLIQ